MSFIHCMFLSVNHIDSICTVVVEGRVPSQKEGYFRSFSAHIFTLNKSLTFSACTPRHSSAFPRNTNFFLLGLRMRKTNKVLQIMRQADHDTLLYMSLTMYRGIRPFKFIHGKNDNSGSYTGDFEPIGTVFEPILFFFFNDEPIGSFSPVQGAL